MRIVAYLYSDPLLESAPDPAAWGCEVDRVYQDLAVPAQSKGLELERSQWQQLLHDCQAHPTDCLLIRQLEDLGDSIQEVSDRLAELKTLGVRLRIAQPGDVVAVSSEQGYQDVELQAELLRLVQQIQTNQRSQRIRQGYARNRVKTLPPPGRAPYGYRRGKTRYTIDRTTAPIVKDFFEQFLLYGSLRGAVRYLSKKYGKKISASTGHRWLTSAVYRGDLDYQSDSVMNTHDAIISREEAAQVDRLLKRNRHLPPRTASAPRSLAGLVVCSECLSSMTVTRVSAPRRDREYLYLRPTACARKPTCGAIPYEQVLQQTILRICEDLPRAVAGVTMPDLDGIKRGISGAIAAKQAILEQLLPLVTEGILDQETADLRAYKVRTEISELQHQLAQLPPVNLAAIAQTVSIPQFWLDLSESERRFYFREFIRQVEVVREGEMWNLKLIFIF